MPHHQAVESGDENDSKPVKKSFTATYLEDDVVFIYIKGDQKGAHFKFEVSEEITRKEQPAPKRTEVNSTAQQEMLTGLNGRLIHHLDTSAGRKVQKYSAIVLVAALILIKVWLLCFCLGVLQTPEYEEEELEQ